MEIVSNGQISKGSNQIVIDFNKSFNGDGSQNADGKEKMSFGDKKESNDVRKYEIKFDDCKIPPMRSDLFFMGGNDDDNYNYNGDTGHIKIGINDGGNDSNSDESKPRKYADYIPHELVPYVECPVCFNLFEEPVTLPCSMSHTVCLNCAKDLIKASIAASTETVETHVSVKCPSCSEVMKLPVTTNEIETFFKKVEPSTEALEFISHVTSQEYKPSLASTVCSKHKSEFISYDISMGTPLCKECIAERGSGSGITLPMKSCSSIVKHTCDVLCSGSLEFENRCEEYVSALDQASVFTERSIRNVENAINAEAEFLHNIINKKKISLALNANKIGKERCKYHLFYYK